MGTPNNQVEKRNKQPQEISITLGSGDSWTMCLPGAPECKLHVWYESKMETGRQHIEP